jgi:putative Mg2+ transporter-C (MgtC) family protein
MEVYEFVLRLLAALVAGVIIGFERQWHHKSAGLRTNTLVAIGSALFVLLSFETTEKNGDPTRIIGQVVTGVGFLGGGIIFREGTNIHGLTSAATVWCSAAIGCLAAGGYFMEAFIGTGLILFINAILRPVDKWLTKRAGKNLDKNNDEIETEINGNTEKTS